jgi:hypothetical protein
MKKSLTRIQKQAQELNFFDDTFINTENDLDSSFRESFKDKLIKGSRGYGYWIWKPQIILQALEKMEDGDILLYADVGCHLNKKGVERLKSYFNQPSLSDSGFVLFQEAVDSPDRNLIISYSHLERVYTKGDIFDYFKARDLPEVSNTGIIAATTFIIRKSPQVQKLIEEWLDIFKNNFNLVNDTPSLSPNFPDFIENRHDQSIFSLLCKMNKIPTISAYELWQEDWKKLEKYPIWAKRDKELTLPWLIRQKILSAVSKIRRYLK